MLSGQVWQLKQTVSFGSNLKCKIPEFQLVLPQGNWDNFVYEKEKDQFYGNNNIPNMFIDWYTYYDYIYLIMLCCITLYSINYINTENIL